MFSLLQAHCSLWQHNIRVSVSLPQRLPARGPGRCGRRRGLPSQEPRIHIFKLSFSKAISIQINSPCSIRFLHQI